MPGASTQELISRAANRLTIAQDELAEALAATPKTDRADKLMVSERLRQALGEIVAAKRALSVLLDEHPRVGILASDDDDDPE